MNNIEKATQVEMRKYVKANGLTKEFKNSMGTYISKSTKPQLKEFLSTFNNKPLIGKVSKLGDPDPEKLEKIRQNIPSKPKPVEIIEETTIPVKKPITVNNDFEIDNDDLEFLNDIVDNDSLFTAPTESTKTNNDTPTETTTITHTYIYDETNEVKCDKLAQLYPQLKEINKSDKFKSSEEKYLYLEQFINRNKSCANITHYFFMVSSYMESNKIVNNYVRLEGYTNQLLKRKAEIETLIEEIKIKYMDEIGEMLDMPCEARLGMVFLETALATHMSNLVLLNQRKEQLKANIRK